MKSCLVVLGGLCLGGPRGAGETQEQGQVPGHMSPWPGVMKALWLSEPAESYRLKTGHILASILVLARTDP